MAAQTDPRAESKGIVDHLLSIFADVKPREGVTALIFTLDVMLLLIAYYLLKTVREPLILKSGGVAAKNYATILQAVVLMGFVPVYALLTKRLGRMTLVTVTHLFFAANLVLFWLLALIDVPGLGGAFFVWLGIFSLVIIAQFWSLANDLYTPEQGKRLFAILGIGGSVGAVAGSYIAKLLFKPLGPYKIMLLSAVLLGCCLVLSWLGNARMGGVKEDAKSDSKTEEKPIGGRNGFALILSDRYLLLIAGIIMVLNLVNTTGEYILDLSQLDRVAEVNPDFKSLEATCEKGKESCAQDADKGACEKKVAEACEKKEKMVEDFVGPFRADFFFWVNLVGAFTQLFLVSRIFKYLGIRAALFSLPLIGIIAYGGIIMFSALAFVRIVKIAENSVDYSLYNTTKQALWLPTSREDKYNAKMTIDSFLVRVADMVSSGLSLGFLALGFTITAYAGANLALVFVWLVLAWLLGRENQARMEEKDAPTSSEAIKKQLKNTVTADSSDIREAIEKAKREKQKR